MGILMKKKQSNIGWWKNYNLQWHKRRYQWIIIQIWQFNGASMSCVIYDCGIFECNSLKAVFEKALRHYSRSIHCIQNCTRNVFEWTCTRSLILKYDNLVIIISVQRCWIGRIKSHIGTTHIESNPISTIAEKIIESLNLCTNFIGFYIMTTVGHVLFWGIVQSLCVHNTSVDTVMNLPKWRVKGFLFTQMIAFPYWCFNEHFDAFAFVFPIFFIIDLITLNLPTYLFVHHIVCLLGHTIACNYNIENFCYYANACAFLELGSGIYCMYDLKYVRFHFLFICMTISNLVALVLAYYWYATESNIFTGLSAFATLVLISSRQITTTREYSKE